MAFTHLWSERFKTNEQRGAYLFAEPLQTATVSVVHSEEEAAAPSSKNTLVLALHPSIQHKYIDGWVERLLQRRKGDLKRESQVSNHKHSQARYRLSKAVQALTLKKSLPSTTHAVLLKQRDDEGQTGKWPSWPSWIIVNAKRLGHL